MSISDQYNSSIELQLRSLEVPPQLPPLFNSIMHCVTLTHHNWLAYMSLLLFIHSLNNVRDITLFTINHVIWIFFSTKKNKCYMDISILQNLLYMLYKLFFTNYKNNSITYLLFYCRGTIIFIVIPVCKSFVIKFVAV